MTGQTTARGAGGAVETVTGTFEGNFLSAAVWYYDGKEYHEDATVEPGESIEVAKNSLLVTKYVNWRDVSGGITTIAQTDNSDSAYLAAFSVTGNFNMLMY